MKQIIQFDFHWPTLPPDAPKWATELISNLSLYLRLIAIRLDKSTHEGLFADRPDADGSKRYYYATDTGYLYYDKGTWVQIGGPGV